MVGCSGPAPTVVRLHWPCEASGASLCSCSRAVVLQPLEFLRCLPKASKVFYLDGLHSSTRDPRSGSLSLETFGLRQASPTTCSIEAFSSPNPSPVRHERSNSVVLPLLTLCIRNVYTCTHVYWYFASFASARLQVKSSFGRK